MPPKPDPYATPLHKRIDAILLIVIFVVVAMLLSTAAHAQTNLYFDNKPGTGIGQSGSFDLTTKNFNTSSGGANVTLTTFTNGSNAIFAGTAGTATLNANVSANLLNFQVSGYTIDASGANKLTLTSTGTGANSAVNATNTSGTTTISAPLILGAAGGATQTFTQASGGTLTLSGPITSTNNVILNLAGGGTILANGTTASSVAVTVSNSGTTLGGTGTISGGVTVNTGATINPGATGGTSVGTLNVGALTLNGGTSAFNFASTTSFDQLGVAGDANLTSGMLSVMIQSGLNFVGGTSYTLINASTLTGQFAGYADNTIYNFSGYDFLVQYDTLNGDFILKAVPEPSTWIGGALALAAVGLTQRRRFQKLARVRGS